MSSLDRAIDEFLKSNDGKRKVNEYYKNQEKGRGNRGFTRDEVTKLGDELYQMLKERIKQDALYSEYNGNLFLDFLRKDIKFYESDSTWNCFINFEKKYDDDGILRKGINKKEVNLARLINNEWKRKPFIVGYDRHGNRTVGSDKYMKGNFKGFIKDVVDKFNALHSKDGIIVKYSKDFDGGTL